MKILDRKDAMDHHKDMMDNHKDAINRRLYKKADYCRDGDLSRLLLAVV
ncbi:hypothetical protein [Nostoc sp.]